MNRLLILVPALAFTSALAAAAHPPTVAEQYLLAAINQERATHNLAPIHLDPALMRAAQAHAQQMAAHRTLSHQLSGEPELPARASQAGAHFARITENVAEGPTVVRLHDAWMRSPGHRANILDPAVDAVGIAVLASNSQLYAVEDFQATVQALTFEQQEAAVGLLLDAAGLELLPSPDARRTCAMSTGYAGQTRPTFLIHFTTNNLSQLPSKLRTELASGHEHRATVGACVLPFGSPFTQYNLAILLYP